MQAFLFIQLAQRVDSTSNKDQSTSGNGALESPQWMGWQCIANKLDHSGKEKLVYKGAQLLRARTEAALSNCSSGTKTSRQLNHVWASILKDSGDYPISLGDEEEIENQPGGSGVAHEVNQEESTDGSNGECTDANVSPYTTSSATTW